MQDKEKISVIIVTDNNRPTILKTLESVVRNLRPPDTVIIGDNDSADNTYALLCQLLGAEMIEQDGKRGWPPKFDGKFYDVPITIFEKRKSNMAGSLNACLHLAPKDTSILGFLKAGDWYASDKINRSIQIFELHPAIGVVVSDCDHHFNNGVVTRAFKRSFNQYALMESYPYDRNFFVRTAVFVKLRGGFNTKFDHREDYDFLLQASEVGLIYHVPEPLHHCIVTKPSEAELAHEQIIRQMTIQRRNALVQKK